MDKRITIRDKKTGKTQDFIWDENKEIKNRHEHNGLDFETAAYIYFDNNKVVRRDPTHSDNEERFQVIGKVDEPYRKLSNNKNRFQGSVADENMLFVISTEPHLDPDTPIRIISARYAEAKEWKIYNTQNNLIEGIRKVPKKFDTKNVKKNKAKRNNRERNKKGYGKGWKKSRKLYKNQFLWYTISKTHLEWIVCYR